MVHLHLFPVVDNCISDPDSSQDIIRIVAIEGSGKATYNTVTGIPNRELPYFSNTAGTAPHPIFVIHHITQTRARVGASDARAENRSAPSSRPPALPRTLSPSNTSLSAGV